MSNVDQLTHIEKALRKPDTDRMYLANQLVQLATVIAHQDESESGLVRGALGGMSYVIDRLREIWKEEGAPTPKSLPELQEIFAQVELARFATNEEDVQKTLTHYRKDFILVNVYKIALPDGTPIFIFSSAKDQTTKDGRKLLQGEVLDSNTSMVPSFTQVYRELTKST